MTELQINLAQLVVLNEWHKTEIQRHVALVEKSQKKGNKLPHRPSYYTNAVAFHSLAVQNLTAVIQSIGAQLAPKENNPN